MAVQSPNLTDVAKVAGVSTATASRVFNDDPRISDETKRKVYDAARAIGYAKPVRTEEPVIQTWGNIGLIVPEVISGYYARLVHFAVDIFAQHFYSVSIRITNYNNDTALKHANDLCASKIYGLLFIIDDSECLSDEIFTVVAASEKPAFFITGNYIPDNDFDSLFIDDHRGIAMLFEHLVDKGYSSIGFIGERLTLERRTAYLASMELHNMAVVDAFIKTSLFRAEKGGYHAMREILNGKSHPDAIIMGYDQMAIGALKAIREAGLTVPGDIAIAAFDDIIESEYIENGITTVQCPCEDIIAIAFRVLMNRIQDRYSAPQQIALKPKLIIRGTT